MNAPLTPPTDHFECLSAQLDGLRRAHLAAPMPNAKERIECLKALSRMMQDHQQAIVQAICDDFGNRSSQETQFCEFVVVLGDIKDAIKHLKGWMKPQRRKVDLTLYPGAVNRVIPQPLGVVGVIVPWNFPLNLSIAPLVGIFAAGNRAMVKMSDRSRCLTRLLAEISPQYLPEDKLVFIEDDGEIGPHFSRLPFDHLLFTGSTATGRKVMASAADNLTPVTLELGGKSPAIIAPDFDLATAASRLMFWKLLNAGQICTTVDYLFLPESSVEPFVALARRLATQRYPDLASADYTSIIDEAAYQRLWDTVDDAKAKGARVVFLTNDERGDTATRKFPPLLLLDVSDDMVVMQREIFGPVLPIKTYRDREEVIEYVNRGPRPLALYPFTRDAETRDAYITRTLSGGVSVNNCLLHVGQHDMPFGGVGASGMGHYHGRDGFMNFSKLRPVYRQGIVDPMKLLTPPYTTTTDKVLAVMQWIAR